MTTPDTAVTPHSSDRVPVLDGLRGLAIALVLINNCFPEKLTAPPFDVAAVHVSRFGWIGVDLFFVLSGFLITGILADTKGGAHYFRNFYARRILRIFPLYYAVLFAVFVIAPRLGLATPDQLRRLHQQQWYYWAYLGNLATMMHGDTTFGLGVYWSLAVEEHFYLFWPLVVLLGTRRQVIGFCIAIMGLSLVMRVIWLAHDLSPAWVYVGTPFRVDGLAVGAMTALILRSPDGPARLVRWAKPVLRAMLPIGLILVGTYEFTQSSAAGFVLQVIGYPILAFAFAALIVRSMGPSPVPVLQRVFSSRFMRFLGRYSYGMYILHAFVLLYFNERHPWTLQPPLVFGSHVPVGVLVILLVAVVTTGLALVSWNVLEKPFLSLKRYFPYAREVQQAPGARTPASPIAAL